MASLYYLSLIGDQRGDRGKGERTSIVALALELMVKRQSRCSTTSVLNVVVWRLSLLVSTIQNMVRRMKVQQTAGNDR